jgi:hypothetical protein
MGIQAVDRRSAHGRYAQPYGLLGDNAKTLHFKKVSI